MVAFLTGSEVDTGDTWDSSAIYCTVVSFGALPNNGTKSVAHGITGIAQTLNMYCAAYDGSNQWQPLAFANNTNSGTYARMNANSLNINCFTNFNATAFTDVYVFVFYTKV